MILYTKDSIPEELKWTHILLDKKEVFLNEYLNYKNVVKREYPVVAEHLNNMITCPYIKAFSVPFFTMNRPLRTEQGGPGYYNGICAPTYQMTPEERSYIKYEKKLQSMYDFYYYSKDDLSYLFKQSLELVANYVPKLWQAMIIEFKPGTYFDPHVHPKFYLTSINLNKADKYMEIQAEGHSVHLNEEEPLLVFDSSYNHIAIEHGKENRILLVVGSNF